MRQLVVFLALIAASCGSMPGGFRMRFDQGTAIGTDFFYAMPRTVPAAVAEGWAAVQGPPVPLPGLVLYCHNSRTICVFYDDTGYVAGFQVAFDPQLVINTILDWEIQGWTQWTADDGKTYWTIQQYFVSEEFLARSQLDRVESRNPDTMLQTEAVWVTGVNKEITKILIDTEEELKDTVFTEQACIPWMGLHYYYKMSNETVCNSETMYPWFQLVHDGQLVGMGLVIFGQMEVDEERDWFERPARPVVEAIVPRGPQCLYEDAENPGLITLHTYYVDEPWTIMC